MKNKGADQTVQASLQKLLFACNKNRFSLNKAHLGLDVTKRVFGVSNKARLKPASSASETS